MAADETRYLRSTHEGGRVKSFSAEAKRVWETATCCGHMLHPDEALTLAEIIQEHRKYGEEFPDESFDYSDEEIEQGLALLVEHGLAKVAGPEVDRYGK